MTCTLMLPSFGTCAHVAQQHLLTCSPAKCILCYRCAAAVRKTFIALRILEKCYYAGLCREQDVA